MFKYLEIASYETDSAVLRIDVTGKSERNTDRIDSGMNRNLNHEDYFTREVDSEEELPEIKKASA